MPRLHSVGAVYEPSYFFISLDTDKCISAALIDNESTVIHEYIHFLQDLLLPYCFRASLARMFTFSYVVEHAYVNGRISVPCDIWHEDLVASMVQDKYTWGCDEWVESVVALEIMEPTYETFLGPRGPFKVYRYKAIVNESIDYYFGARDFLEYVAYKIEGKHWPDQVYDLPYRSVDFLFDRVGLSFVSDEVRMCIVEYCLLNDHPVRRFFVIIDDIKRQCPEILGSYEDCLRVLSVADWSSYGQKPETILSKFDRRMEGLGSTLERSFLKMNSPELRNWIRQAMAFVKENLANRFFFSELYRMNKADFLSAIGSVVGSIGVPLIKNNCGEVFSFVGGVLGGVGEFINLLLARKLYLYILEGGDECPVMDVCQRMCGNNIDDGCGASPFVKAVKGSSCLFGDFVRMHGLDQVDWVVSSA